ncbi:MAG TPA: hypothetical protein VFW11_23265 [Cyclobacteriaceae bacterium]|nr:hypothetical protein [Cyclobacteriaceae bacterium]
MIRINLSLLFMFVTFLAVGQLYIPGAIVNSNSPATYLEFNASTLWNGTIRANGSNYTSFALYQDNALRWAMYNHPGNSNTLIFANSSGQDKISFTQTGFIGIGTIAPQKPLHISGTDDVEQWIEATNDGYASLTLRSNNKQWHWSKRPSTSGDALQLYYHNGSAWSSPYMAFLTDGRVGIGTTPATKLDVNGNFQIYPAGNAGVSGALKLRIASGTSSTILEANSDNTWANHDIVINAASQTTGGNQNQVVIHRSGNVGIGTSSPDNKLTVKGTVHAEEIKVDLNVPAPDYVFEKSYDLLSLDEVEEYINVNKHLPEIPSAKTIEEEGLNLKEMNLLLLKKVEELTLYLLEQDKRNDQLTLQLRELQVKIEELQLKTK